MLAGIVVVPEPVVAPVEVLIPSESSTSKQFTWAPDGHTLVGAVREEASDVAGSDPEFAMLAVAVHESPGERFETVKVSEVTPSPPEADQAQLE